MEIEEKELDTKEMLGSWAILIKYLCMDLSAVNCWLNMLECKSATSSIAQRTCVAVDQQLRGHKAFGCN